MIIEHFYDTQEQMFSALKKTCEQQLVTALQQHARATFLVSGGSTTKPLYQALSQSDVAWNNIDIALVDERWVGVDHSASNEGFIRQSLLQNNANLASFTGMKNSQPSALLGVTQCEEDYRQLAKPLSLCILGMGADGHTASWFPHAKGLSEALTTPQCCAAIQASATDVTGAFTERMTISLAQVKKCEQVILLFTGDTKRTVYDKALTHSDFSAFPVAALLDGSIPINVYWAP